MLVFVALFEVCWASCFMTPWLHSYMWRWLVLRIQRWYFCSSTKMSGKRPRRAAVSAMNDLSKNSKRLLYAAGYMIDSDRLSLLFHQGRQIKNLQITNYLIYMLPMARSSKHMAQKWMNFISWDIDASIVWSWQMSHNQFLELIFFSEGDDKVCVIDIAHGCLIDRETFCTTRGQFRNTSVHSIARPSWKMNNIDDSSARFTKLLSEFPDIMETDLGKVAEMCMATRKLPLSQNFVNGKRKVSLFAVNQNGPHLFML